MENLILTFIFSLMSQTSTSCLEKCSELLRGGIPFHPLVSRSEKICRTVYETGDKYIT